MKNEKRKLKIVADCNGCGVCCFHMGYPPFIRPDGDRKGEKWWYQLPDDLRVELDDYIANYEHKEYGDDVRTFDGPCFWFNMETRQCKHHLHRPNVCRDFDTGSKKCLEWRKYYHDSIIS